jgi:hypothetical protein
MGLLSQTKDLFENYFNYDTITRFEINDKEFYPELTLDLVPEVQNLTKLKDIYPEIKVFDQRLIKEGINSFSDSALRDMALDSKFEEMHEVFGTEKFIKSCELLRGRQSYDCLDSRKGINMNTPINTLTFSLILSNKTRNSLKFKGCHREKFDKIRISLLDIGRVSLAINDCEEGIFKRFECLIEERITTRLSFRTFSVKKVSKPQDNCVNDARYPFWNYYSGSCINDCLLFYSNLTFGCLLNDINLFHLEFEFHVSYLGYRICEQRMNLNESMAIKDIKDYCISFCLPKCETINFDTKVEKKSYQSRETIIEVHPLKSRHMEYIETLKTDFNQLIYNCGGIIGLWFGLSSINITDLLTILWSVWLRLWRCIRKLH